MSFYRIFWVRFTPTYSFTFVYGFTKGFGKIFIYIFFFIYSNGFISSVGVYLYPSDRQVLGPKANVNKRERERCGAWSERERGTVSVSEARYTPREKGVRYILKKEGTVYDVGEGYGTQRKRCTVRRRKLWYTMKKEATVYDVGERHGT